MNDSSVSAVLDVDDEGSSATTSEVDVETRLRAVDRELDEIDMELDRLKTRRRILLQLKDNLRVQRQQAKSDSLAKKDWHSEQFGWSADVRRVLKDVFHMKDFRAQQLPAINAILSKQDVLLLAPTGGGKSLCYQLPALVANGITLIVSPLISLMEDQVWALRKLGIKAELLCSNAEKETVNTVHRMLREGDSENMRLVYITPERLSKSNRFMSALQKCYNLKKLAQIAIDEVHCCSQWGHDFRPDYKLLSVFKTTFPDVPILGVTATATAKVISDVQKMLNLRGCLLLNAPFNRPNLYYHVLEKPSDKDELYELLADLLKRKYRGMSGIIYTQFTKDTEEISTQLLQLDVKVLPYHGQLEAKQRSKTHQKWRDNEIQAVVATTAFGMGIDKPDVRFVIHHTMSKSMENFYQESGRAGRDGKRADCILLYRFQDIFKLSTMTMREHEGLMNLYSMVKYCINGKEMLISRHFAEVWDDTHCNKLCDRCYYRDKVQLPEQDITHHYQSLMAILRRAETLQTKLTALKLVDAWYHKGSPKNRLETPPPLLDRYIGEQIVAFLIVNGYLKEDFQYNPFTTVGYIARGSALIDKDGIRFQGARVLRVPTDSLRSIISHGSTVNSPCANAEVSSTSTSGRKSSNSTNGSGRSSKRKTLESESNDRDETISIRSDSESSLNSAATSSSSGGSKKERKRQKTESVECSTPSRRSEPVVEDRQIDVAKRINELIAKEMHNRTLKEEDNKDDDEDVLFVPPDDDVIVLDEA